MPLALMAPSAPCVSEMFWAAANESLASVSKPASRVTTRLYGTFVPPVTRT